MNNQQFDGGQLSEKEKKLRDFYRRLLNFTLNSPALMGNYQDIHAYNRENTEGYNQRVHAFVRWSDEERLIIVTNFDEENKYSFDLKIPSAILESWQLDNGDYTLTDQLYGKSMKLSVDSGTGSIPMEINPLESFILKME